MVFGVFFEVGEVHAGGVFEEFAEVCDIFEAELEGYFFHAAVGIYGESFCLEDYTLAYVVAGGCAGCLFDDLVEVVGCYVKVPGVVGNHFTGGEVFVEKAHEVLYQLHAFKLCGVAGGALVLAREVDHKDLEEATEHFPAKEEEVFELVHHADSHVVHFLVHRAAYRYYRRCWKCIEEAGIE